MAKRRYTGYDKTAKGPKAGLRKSSLTSSKKSSGCGKTVDITSAKSGASPLTVFTQRVVPLTFLGVAVSTVAPASTRMPSE